MTHGLRPWQSIAGGAALVLAVLLAPAAASEKKPGLSAFGDLAYPANFEHFAYANPDAPKGGTFSLVGWGGVTTFNSLNNYILKGDAAQGLELLFDSLMVPAADEPDAVYGLVAESAEVADDGKSVTFYLRPEAKFADGTPLTADDVVFSFDTLKNKGHPIYHQTLQDVVKAEALDPHTVRYTFSGDLVRDLPLTVATLPIFSKAYYATRPFEETTLDAPLGSGPYLVDSLAQGRTIVYRRNPDYWAKDLPVNRGRWNFDKIRFEYFRDRTPAMEAFKAGTYDFREEFTAKVWATEYDFPAIRAGKVKKEVLADETPSGTQGFFLNTRREALKDPRVREALDLAFDFEWSNRNMFYDQYTRTQSFFENSAMKAEGEPSEAERTLMAGLGVPVSDAALGPAYLPAQSDGSGQDRKLLLEGRQAARRGRLDGQERRPRQRARRAAQARDPDVRAGLRADRRALCEKSQAARHRRQHPHGRSGAISAATQGFRFRHHHRALPDAQHPRRGAQELFRLRRRQDGRLAQSCRHLRPGRRRADRAGHRRQEPRGAEYRRPRARSRAQGRPLLGAALVQGLQHHRLLGQVFAARDQAPLRPWHSGHLVV